MPEMVEAMDWALRHPEFWNGYQLKKLQSMKAHYDEKGFLSPFQLKFANDLLRQGNDHRVPATA